MKSKELYFPEYDTSSGVSITYVKSRNASDIGGWEVRWHEPCSIQLQNFLIKLDITLKDCEKEFRGE